MRIRTFALAASALAIWAGAAHAAVITQTQNFGPGTPNFGASLVFDRYHLNPADLVSVKVSLQLNITGGQLIVDNDGAGMAEVDVTLGAHGTISSVDVPLLDMAFQPFSGNANASNVHHFSLMPDDGDGVGHVDMTGPDGAQMLGGPAGDMQMAFINPAVWAAYEGLGTFSINAAISQILNFGGVGGVEGGFSPVAASGSVTVEYEYRLVPTPGAAAILALGGLGALRRRR